MSARKDASTLGYLLMDASAERWYDPALSLWIVFAYHEDGKEVADFLPPPKAFRPDLPTARKDAKELSQLGIDARPVRIAYSVH